MARKLFFNIILGIAAILIGVWGFNRLSSMKKARPEIFRDQVASAFIDTVTLSNETIFISTNGTLQAKTQIDLTSKVQGIFESSSRNFKEGVSFRKGDLMIRVDNQDVQVTLQTQKSQLLKALIAMQADLKFDFPDVYEKWKAYSNSFQIDGPLAELPEVSDDREKAFISLKDIYTLYYTAKATENNLRHYRIYAPFTGVLTEVNVNPGAMIIPGQKLGTFISENVFELEVKLPMAVKPLIREGETARLTTLSEENTWTGTVKRIQSKVDPASQSFLVIIEVKGDGLISGMYLQAEIKTREIEEVYEIPRPLLINNSEIFLVKDSILVLKTIEPVYFKEKSLLIKGIENGETLLKNLIPGAYQGMKVIILED
jgi:multidrug efflux pump subunit AcrA (membrane-fusion protein)